MAWYSSWSRAQRLVITVPSGTTAALSYFPVVLTASSLPTELTNNIYGSSTGADLAFAADLGLGNSFSSIGGQLPCEVVSASFGGTPSAEIHVQVPSVAATGTLTYIWVLYQNPSQSSQPAASSTYGSQAVWNENGTHNYQGVWHLNSTTIYDSTGLNANGTNTGTPTVVSGELGNGLSYSSSQYSTIPAITGLNGVSAAGITAWVKRNTSGAIFAVTAKDGGPGSVNMSCLLGNSNGYIYNYLYNGSSDFFDYYASNTTIWTKYEYFFNGSTVLTFVNGSSISATTNGACPSALSATGASCYINNFPYYSFMGNASYDEVRISVAVRSASWIAAEYSNQSAAGTFIQPPSGQGPLVYTATASGSAALAALTTAGLGVFSATATGSAALAALTTAGAGGFTATASGTAALAALTTAGAGGFTATASGTAALAALTTAGAGGFTAMATGSAALAALTTAGLGVFSATATGSAVLAGLTLAGSGSATGPGGATGAGSVAMGALTTAGAGVFTAPSTGSIALAALTAAGAGAYTSPGDSLAYGVVVLTTLTAAGAGAFTAPGHGSAALAALTAAGAGAFTAPGHGSAALAALTAAGSGMFTATASGSAALAALTAAGAGAFTAPGHGSAALAALTAAGSGMFTATASGSAALAALTAAGSGMFTATASGSAALAALTTAGSGVFSATATGSAALAALTTAGLGVFSATATGSAALTALTTAGAGVFYAAATGSVSQLTPGYQVIVNRPAAPPLINNGLELGVQIPPEGDFLGQSYDVVAGLVVVCPADTPCPPLAVGDVWTFAGTSYTVFSIQLYGAGTVPAATIGAQAGPDAVTFTTGAVASVATLLSTGTRFYAASKIPNPYALH